MKIWIYWSESNSWIYFYIHTMYVVLNKNWKIYRPEQSFACLGLELIVRTASMLNYITGYLIYTCLQDKFVCTPHIFWNAWKSILRNLGHGTILPWLNYIYIISRWNKTVNIKSNILAGKIKDTHLLSKYSSPSLTRPLPLKTTPLIRPHFICTEIVQYY